MADNPLDAITNIGQKALAAPAELMNIGAKRVTEDLSMLSAKANDLGSALLPAGGMGLPPLPGLPGAGAAAAPAPAPAATRSEVVQGVKKAKQMSYLRV